MKPVLENINADKESSILTFKYSSQNFDTPWHFHPQFELTYIEKSFGTKFIGDYVGSYKPQELVLVGSNLPHCWKNSQNKNTLSESIIVQWNKNSLAKIPELKNVFELLKKANRGLIFSKQTSKKIKPELNKILKLNNEEKYLQLLKILIILTKESYIFLSEGNFNDELANNHQDRIGKIHHFVDKHYQKKIHLLEVATIVGMSEQSFSRFFSKLMGRPFFSYLNEYRINIASRLLLDTDMSVSEIGYSCGYESLPFFYKQFKKVKNETPFKYRKNHS